MKFPTLVNKAFKSINANQSILCRSEGRVDIENNTLERVSLQKGKKRLKFKEKKKNFPHLKYAE